MPLPLACLLAYLLGAIPVGYLIGRASGVDLTREGSGNIGATNAVRVLGVRLGLTVFALDVLKGLVAALAGASLSVPPPGMAVTPADSALILGALAVVGHSLSPFLRFRGGKGIATGFGALLGTAPIVGLSGFLGFLGALFLTRYVSLSSLVGCSAVLVGALVTRQSPAFLAVYGSLVVYVVVKHAPNISRLLRGVEPKAPFFNVARPKTPRVSADEARSGVREGPEAP